MSDACSLLTVGDGTIFYESFLAGTAICSVQEMFSPSWYNMREYFLKALKWSDNVISHKNNKYVISGGFFVLFCFSSYLVI